MLLCRLSLFFPVHSKAQFEWASNTPAPILSNQITVVHAPCSAVTHHRAQRLPGLKVLNPLVLILLLDSHTDGAVVTEVLVRWDPVEAKALGNAWLSLRDQSLKILSQRDVGSHPKFREWLSSLAKCCGDTTALGAGKQLPVSRHSVRP